MLENLLYPSQCIFSNSSHSQSVSEISVPLINSQPKNEIELLTIKNALFLSNFDTYFNKNEFDISDDLEKVKDWSEILSMGEQQKLSIARLFLNNPEIVK